MAGIKDGSLTLYYTPGSYYSMKAVHALLEKRVPFKRFFVDIHGGGDQYSAWYLKMNPSGVVPVLKHGDTIVYESEAIIDYVDKICPSVPRLVPDPDTSLGQEVLNLRKLLHDNIHIDWISYGVIVNELSVSGLEFPFINPTPQMIANIFKHWGKHKQTLLSQHPELKEELEKKTKRNEEFRNVVFDKAKVMKLLDDLDNIFDVLETQLQKTVSAHVNTAYSVLWLFGSEVTAADITVQVFLNRMRMLGLIERYCGNGKRPLVVNYLLQMNQRPTVQETLAGFKYLPKIFLKSAVKSKLPLIGAVLTVGLMLAAGYFVYQKNK